MTNQSYVGFKWQINGNSEGDNYKQERLMNNFSEKLKKDQEEFENNVPQVEIKSINKKLRNWQEENFKPIKSNNIFDLIE